MIFFSYSYISFFIFFYYFFFFLAFFTLLFSFFFSSHLLSPFFFSPFFTSSLRLYFLILNISLRTLAFGLHSSFSFTYFAIFFSSWARLYLNTLLSRDFPRPPFFFFFSLIIFLALFSSPINDQQLCQEDSHDRMGDEQNQTRSEVGQSIKLMKKAIVVDLSHLALSIALLL